MIKERPPKPRKQDFSDTREFMKASAAWAEQWNVWPWGGPKDEDDDYVYVVVDQSSTQSQKEEKMTLKMKPIPADPNFEQLLIQAQKRF